MKTVPLTVGIWVYNGRGVSGDILKMEAICFYHAIKTFRECQIEALQFDKSRNALWGRKQYP